MTKENLTAPSFKLVSTGKENFNLKTSVGMPSAERVMSTAFPEVL